MRRKRLLVTRETVRSLAAEHLVEVGGATLLTGSGSTLTRSVVTTSQVQSLTTQSNTFQSINSWGGRHTETNCTNCTFSSF